MKYFVIATLLMPFMVSAKVTPGSLVTDNMVLQQNTGARLYGAANPGSTVTAIPSWSNKAVTTKADKDGKWLMEVQTPEGSYTPYTITLSDATNPATDKNAVKINNVLVGEVWLASGQSNMQMPLKGFPGCNMENGFEEIAKSNAKADKIRFYNVPMSQSYEPLESVEAVWTVPSPDTATEYSGTAWYYANRLNDVLDVPVGIVSCAYGGAKVESWTPKDILESYGDVNLDPAEMEKMTHYYRPYLMYNAMFVPSKDYTYKGIIWYQGCSNVGEHANYATRLNNMVTHWRKELGLGDIPFYQVEIAPYDYNSEEGKPMAPLLRQAQWDACNIIPNSGIICTNDLVQPFERFNIHPSDKKDVGNRLGDLALNKTYGKKQFLADSPRYKSHSFKDGEAWVAIDDMGGGIGRNYMIEGFEVAGPDKVFHPADSVWLHWQTNEMVVSSKKVPEPVAVRYGWRDFLPGNVSGGNKLPLIPFRSDDW